MSIKKSVRAVSLLIVGLGLTVNVYAQSFLTNGLVAYYPFNGNANDASGNGHNGAVHGVTLTADRFGNPTNAFSFNGSSWIDIGNVASRYDILTLSAWVYTTDANTTSDGKGIVSKPRNDYSGGLALAWYAGTFDAEFNNGAVNLAVFSPTQTTGSWHQAMAVTSVTNVSLYVDGQLSATTHFASNPITSSVSMFIGKSFASGELRFFTGTIDDVRIYNRALSSNEVAQLYTIEATPPTGFETNGLVGYYPFDGNASDVSGNANNGTVHGATLTTDRFGIQGKAMAFNGIDQYVEAPHQTYLNFPAGDFTVTFWAAVNDLSRLQYFVGKDMGQGINNKWITLYSPNPSFLGFGIVINGPAYAFANVSSVPGTWHQFIYRKSSTQYSVHFDGVLVSSSQGPASLRSDNTAPLRIGQCEDGGYVYGKLDDVRIYNRALSSQEVAELYGLESGPGVGLVKAVKPSFFHLWAGTNYQLQMSIDMTNWINQGAPFTATNRSMVYPQYFDVPYWGNLYFRLY